MAQAVADTLGGPKVAFLHQAYMAVAIFFLLAPIVAVTIGSLTTTQYVVFPPKGLTLRWYGQMFDRPEMLSSFLLSLGIAAAAATVAVIVAVLASLALVRHRSGLNILLWMLVVSPMMLPATVLGVAALQSYTGLGFGSSPLGLLAGHLVLVTPIPWCSSPPGSGPSTGRSRRRPAASAPRRAGPSSRSPSRSWPGAWPRAG